MISLICHRQASTRPGGHGQDVVIGDKRGADPDGIGGRLQPDVTDPGADFGERRDLVSQRATIPGAVAKHHVYLVGLIES